MFIHEGIRDATRATEILFGVLAATARPALCKVLIEQIEDTLAARPGLAPAGRTAGLSKAQAPLLVLEAQEELAIRSLEEAGVQVIRRDDVDPRMLLATDAALARLAE